MFITIFNRSLNASAFIFSLFLSSFLTQHVFAQELELDSDDKKYSYAIGNKIGQQMVKEFGNQQDIDLEVLLQGIAVIVSGNTPLLSEQEINEVLQQKQQQLLAEANAIAEKNVIDGKMFLEKNKSKKGVITTASGLQYKILASGDADGDSATLSDTVVVHYRGSLINGTVFDSSYARGEPVTFDLGSIIPGWQEALQLMKVGDKWAVVLPSELAYGKQGSGQSIAANETLLFDIELLEVRKSDN